MIGDKTMRYFSALSRHGNLQINKKSLLFASSHVTWLIQRKPSTTTKIDKDHCREISRHNKQVESITISFFFLLRNLLGFKITLGIAIGYRPIIFSMNILN